MLDEEDERVVGNELLLRQKHGELGDGPRGGRRLRAFLVHVHDGLVDHLGYEEVPGPRHAGQVRLATEEIRRTQAGQGLSEVVSLLQLEPGQLDPDLEEVQALGSGPLPQLLQSQLLFNLE